MGLAPARKGLEPAPPRATKVSGASTSKSSSRERPGTPEPAKHYPSLAEKEHAWALDGEIGWLRQHHKPVPEGMLAAAHLNTDAVAAWVRSAAAAGGARWQAVAPSWGEASILSIL